MNDTPVLFIAGYGRSGSTLLDLCLNAIDGVDTVGELRFVWENGYRQNTLCGCGTPFLACPTWSAIRRLAFAGEAEDLVPILRDKAAVDRWRHLPMLSAPRLRTAGFRAALARYGEVLRRLLAAARQVHGGAWVVDSSKDPTHGLILAATPGIRLHVVHLVRDPRAAAFSRRRVKQRLEVADGKATMPRQRIVESALEWVFLNRLAEAVAARAAAAVRVRYEAFAEDPAGVLETVRHRLGLPAGASPFAGGGRHFLPGESHGCAGNPMRFQDGAIEVRLDEEWRSAMRPADRRIVSALTAGARHRYGYAD